MKRRPPDNAPTDARSRDWMDGPRPWHDRLESARLWTAAVYPFAVAVFLFVDGHPFAGLLFLLVSGAVFASCLLIDRHRRLCRLLNGLFVPYEREEYDDWAPLAATDMVSPWWLRGLVLVFGVSVIVLPIHLAFTQQWPPSPYPLGLSLASAYATIIGFAVQGQRVDDYLRLRRYRVCPRCKKPLERRPNHRDVMSEEFQGACPGCRLEYSQVWLERTWAGMQARRANARGRRG